MTREIDPSEKLRHAATPGPAPRPGEPGYRIVLPLHAEELAAKKRRRETATVRIRKSVRQEVVPVDHTLRRDDWAIERVPANRIVDVAPAPRWEGKTLILPIVEEVLVKQLRLIEEVRITRRRTVDRKTRAVPLRREVITVERNEHSRRPDTPPLADTPNNNGGSDGTDDRGQIR